MQGWENSVTSRGLQSPQHCERKGKDACREGHLLLGCQVIVDIRPELAAPPKGHGRTSITYKTLSQVIY